MEEMNSVRVALTSKKGMQMQKNEMKTISLSNHPDTTFTPPLKVGDLTVTGICHHRDSMLVIHDKGATDWEYVSEGVKEEILKRLNDEHTTV